MWVSFLSNVFPEKKRTINELLEIVEMTEFADVKTKFKRGQQQRGFWLGFWL
jgi:hypothetical protein